jgi:hypothetical protein
VTDDALDGIPNNATAIAATNIKRFIEPSLRIFANHTPHIRSV